MWGSRSDVNLHHPQTATEGDTSGPGSVMSFVFFNLLQQGARGRFLLKGAPLHEQDFFCMYLQIYPVLCIFVELK